MKPDFGRTAKDYARHRAGFPESFFDRLRAAEIGLPGQRVVDLGTGTGALAQAFAEQGCQVTGVDPSQQMLDEAHQKAIDAGVEVEFRCAPAEHTGLDPSSTDVVTAGQCWHWFDRPAVAREASRILATGGRIVIAHFDWVPLQGNVAFATEELILAYNPGWGLAAGTGLHPLWLRDLGESGYRDIESFSYDVEVIYSHEDWRGRIRASAGVSATLSPARVVEFDRDLERLLEARFPAEWLRVPHRVFAVLATAPVDRPLL